MAGSRRREKEVVAVAFNQKEQRVLEKSLATLRLEAAYSLKLLDLHNRSVKVHFRQMKDKVSRIKSHLEPDEIHELRRLESEGKLQPMYPAVSLGSALKIAAAARRLNSSHRKGPGPGGQPRAKSALPRVTLPSQGTGAVPPPPPGLLKRSNSVTGVFIDVPPPPAVGRPGSASVAVVGSSSTPSSRPNTAHSAAGGVRGVNGHPAGSSDRASLADPRLDSSKSRVGSGGSGRPGSRGTGTRLTSSHHLHNGSSSFSSMESQHSRKSVSPSSSSPNNKLQVDPQPSTRSSSILVMHGQGHSREGMRSRKTSAATSHSRGTGSHSHAPFSSHVATEKEAREREESSREMTAGGGGGSVMTPRSPHASTERNSSSFLGLQDDLVDDLGEDLFAERRAELLEEEQYRSAAISRRKDRFLQDIDQYLKEHPPFNPSAAKPASVKSRAQEDKGQEGGEVLNGGGGVLRQRRVEFNTSPTYLPEQDYRERLMGLWRDMNKCRYLRVPDDMIDLSGINTLASDTMRLFQVLKHREVQPLSNAWTEGS